ncbi:UNVERIFIED_CONTAM: hypothetical protein FKN15_030882 [Acipenser sinensis]
MAFKLVICDNCMMWEIRENPTELNQVCVKCHTIQDLLQRLSLLEKELEEMRQQQELEELAHPQFMEVCTEMEESRNSWLTEDLEKEEKKNAALQDCTDSLLQRIADVYPDILEQVIKTLEEEC